jgi:hypothetical protein
MMDNTKPPGTPAKRALAVLDSPPSSADAVAPGRISRKVRTAIDAMVAGDCRNITAAAEKVGMARESLSRALNKPHIAEHLRQKVIRSLAMASARAGAVTGIARQRQRNGPRPGEHLRVGPLRDPAGHHSFRQRQHRSEGRLRHRPYRRPAPRRRHRNADRFQRRAPRSRQPRPDQRRIRASPRPRATCLLHDPGLPVAPPQKHHLSY